MTSIKIEHVSNYIHSGLAYYHYLMIAAVERDSLLHSWNICVLRNFNKKVNTANSKKFSFILVQVFLLAQARYQKNVKYDTVYLYK